MFCNPCLWQPIVGHALDSRTAHHVTSGTVLAIHLALDWRLCQVHSKICSFNLTSSRMNKLVSCMVVKDSSSELFLLAAITVSLESDKLRQAKQHIWIKESAISSDLPAAFFTSDLIGQSAFHPQIYYKITGCKASCGLAFKTQQNALFRKQLEHNPWYYSTRFFTLLLVLHQVT